MLKILNSGLRFLFFSFFFFFALGGNSNRIEMFDFCDAFECELDPDIGRYVSF